MVRTLFVLLSCLLCACELEESIVIDAPPEAVWAYLADNHNASDWSTYFASIETISSYGQGDAAVGSIRRCFRKQGDATSPYWDELTLMSQAPRYRRILSFNFHGFKNPAFAEAQFVVHNRLVRREDGKTELSFASAKWAPESLSSTLELVSVAGPIQDTFRVNLENIKAAVESRARGAKFERVHAFIPQGKHALDAL